MSRKWMMWAGCGVMVPAGVYLLWTRGYQNILSYGLLLLCPLSHLLLMGGHNHGGHAHAKHDHGPTSASDQKPACH